MPITCKSRAARPGPSSRRTLVDATLSTTSTNSEDWTPETAHDTPSGAGTAETAITTPTKTTTATTSKSAASSALSAQQQLQFAEALSRARRRKILIRRSRQTALSWPGNIEPASWWLPRTTTRHHSATLSMRAFPGGILLPPAPIACRHNHNQQKPLWEFTTGGKQRKQGKSDALDDSAETDSVAINHAQTLAQLLQSAPVTLMQHLLATAQSLMTEGGKEGQQKPSQQLNLTEADFRDALRLLLQMRGTLGPVPQPPSSRSEPGRKAATIAQREIEMTNACGDTGDFQDRPFQLIICVARAAGSGRPVAALEEAESDGVALPGVELWPDSSSGVAPQGENVQPPRLTGLPLGLIRDPDAGSLRSVASETSPVFEAPLLTEQKAPHGRRQKFAVKPEAEVAGMGEEEGDDKDGGSERSSHLTADGAESELVTVSERKSRRFTALARLTKAVSEDELQLRQELLVAMQSVGDGRREQLKRLGNCPTVSCPAAVVGHLAAPENAEYPELGKEVLERLLPECSRCRSQIELQGLRKSLRLSQPMQFNPRSSQFSDRMSTKIRLLDASSQSSMSVE